MPLKKIDYDNIHFYKIVCNDFRVKGLLCWDIQATLQQEKHNTNAPAII